MTQQFTINRKAILEAMQASARTFGDTRFQTLNEVLVTIGDDAITIRSTGRPLADIQGERRQTIPVCIERSDGEQLPGFPGDPEREEVSGDQRTFILNSHYAEAIKNMSRPDLIVMTDGLTTEVTDGLTRLKMRSSLQQIDDYPAPWCNSSDSNCIERLQSRSWMHLGPAIRRALAVVYMGAREMERGDRSALTGVCFEIERNNLTLWSSDSYRLTREDCGQLPGTVPGGRFVVPARPLAEMTRGKRNVEPIGFHLTETTYEFVIGQTVFTGPLISEPYPNVGHLIPKEWDSTVRCNRTDLAMAIKAVAPKKNDVVVLNRPKFASSLAVSREPTLNDPASGSDATASVQCMAGEEVKVLFRSSFLGDALAGVSDETVEIKVAKGKGTGLVPLQWKPSMITGEDCTYVHVLVPRSPRTAS